MSTFDPKYRNHTGITLLLFFCALLVWDLILATDSTDGNTISEVLAGAPTPGILLAGYLIGHFWPIKQVLKLAWAEPAEDVPSKKDQARRGEQEEMSRCDE